MAHVGEELRLVLARLGKLAALVLDFVEQPRVLDRDYRLVGEGRSRSSICFSVNGRTSVPSESDDADRRSLAQERHSQHRSKTGTFDRLRTGIFRVSEHVGDVNGLRPRAAVRPTAVCRARLAIDWRSHPFAIVGRIPVSWLPGRKRLAFTAEDECHDQPHTDRVADSDECLEHHLQIKGRAADDLKHVCGGSLLLERLAKSRVRACTSSNSRTFSIAITAWSAKVVTSSICLSVNGRTALRCKNDHPDRRAFAQQGNAEDSAIAAESCCLRHPVSGSARTS